MPSHHGSFIWYELMTADPAGAQAFYADVVGWSARPAPHAPVPYTLFSAGDVAVAGAMAAPEGLPPHWMGQVAVDDVDAAAAQAKTLGGSVTHGPADLPIGRFAVIADPQGGHITVFKGHMPTPPALPDEPGFGAWRELYTSDLDGAAAFYSALFGWTKSAAIEMGSMGVYQLFARDGVDIGGMMTRPPQMPVTGWAYYFSTDAIGAAMRRISSAGGTVVNGPHQVPGGQWIVQALDPQGAMFALVSWTE